MTTQPWPVSRGLISSLSTKTPAAALTLEWRSFFCGFTMHLELPPSWNKCTCWSLEETAFHAKELSAQAPAPHTTGGSVDGGRRRAGGGTLLLFHLVSCYLLGFCQGSGRRQVHIPRVPLPHPGLMSITRGEILHYCQSESVAVTLAHVMQSLMH